MTEAEILAHEDYQYKQTVDAIQDKKDEDIYVYPSLIPLGEPVEWSDNIMGHSDRTLDLGGQHSPNSVAIKQLIGRSNFLKIRQEGIMVDISKLYNKGGVKNLLVNADFSVNQDGVTSYTQIDPLTYVCDKWVANVADMNNLEPRVDVVVDSADGVIVMNSSDPSKETKLRQPIRYVNGKSILKQGETYTLSFYAKADIGVNVSAEIWNSAYLSWDGNTPIAGGVLGTGTGEWERYSITFVNNTAPLQSDRAVMVALKAYGSHIEFKMPQLEKNDKATDFDRVPKAITELLCLDEYEIGHGSFCAVTGTLQAVGINFVGKKAATPIIEIYAFDGTKNSVSSIGDSGGHVGSVTAVAQNGTTSLFRATVSGLTSGSAYMYKYVADARFY